MEVQRITSVDENLAQKINTLLDEGKVWDIEQGEKFLNNPDNALFLAYSNGEIAGFLSAHRLQRFDERKAEVLLYEVGVHENFRQRGLGKTLIEAIKNWAKEVGADEVWVLTNTSNEAAMALYKSVGGVEDEPGTTMFTYKI